MTDKKLPFEDVVAINVEHMSRETKAKIQEKAFELGFGWSCGHEKFVQFTGKSYMWYILATNGDITYSRLEVASNWRSPREITLRELMETEVPSQEENPWEGWVAGALVSSSVATTLRELMERQPDPEVTPEPQEVTGPGFVDLRGESEDTKDALRSHLRSLGYKVEESSIRNWFEVLPGDQKVYVLTHKHTLYGVSEETEYTVQDILAMKAPELTGTVYLPTEGVSERQAVQIVNALYDAGIEHRSFCRTNMQCHHCWNDPSRWLRINLSDKTLWWSQDHTDALVTVDGLLAHLGTVKTPEPELTEEEKIQQALPEELKGLKVGDMIRFTEELCGDSPKGFITEVTRLQLAGDGSDADVKVTYLDSVGDDWNVWSSQGTIEKLSKPNRKFYVDCKGSKSLATEVAEHLESLGYVYRRGMSWGAHDGSWILKALDGDGTFFDSGIREEEELTIAQVFQLTRSDIYV